MTIDIPEDDLLIVDEEILIERYNACLIDMKLRPTVLKKFRIDRMGWSPDVATEMNNIAYLSHGEANPFAIILTPDQRYLAIVCGFHSFDHALMEQWYSTFSEQIAELTTRTAIWLDIDQDVPVYRDPEDLLMVTEVIVRTNTPDHIMSKVDKQIHYTRNIMRTDDLMEIEKNAQKLCASVQDIGDMRGKDVRIPDMTFAVHCTYFTRAFGGTFILCNEHTASDVLIFNRRLVSHQNGVTSPIDQNVLRSLEALGLITYDLSWWMSNTAHLRVVRESFLMEVFDKYFPDLDVSDLNHAEKKQYINQVRDALPDEYCHLSHVICRLEDGKQEVEIEESIRPYLAYPATHLEECVRDVLWHLLVLVCDGRRIDCLYVYDREGFDELYQRWQMPRRTWAKQIVHKQST